jgi:ribonuclease BN (tRNA processing enzyme)
MSEVVFVGTSDAFGAGGRRQSALLVRAPQGAVLLDCGLTTVTGLVALGIERDEIDAIVVSHFHGDHFGGIPFLSIFKGLIITALPVMICFLYDPAILIYRITRVIRH